MNFNCYLKQSISNGLIFSKNLTIAVLKANKIPEKVPNKIPIPGICLSREMRWKDELGWGSGVGGNGLES